MFKASLIQLRRLGIDNNILKIILTGNATLGKIIIFSLNDCIHDRLILVVIDIQNNSQDDSNETQH